jgi:DNA-binding LacI/PurR family transcriptional regulator
VLSAAGLSMPDEMVGMTHYLAPYTTLQRLLREGVTGLFIADDQLTYEIPFVCSEAMGLSLPRDLSVVGMGLSSALQFNRPPLTLVASPINEMADRGVQLLDELIHAMDRTPRTINLMPELIVRESVTKPKA